MTRECTTCGKPLTHTPYELWLFYTCRSCASEPAPARWRDYTGTARKWRYVPRWHLTSQNGGMPA